MARVHVVGNRLLADTFSCPISHGLNGYTVDKNEGDMCTPVGKYRFEAVYYRPDRMARPLTHLPVHKISADMGWCDDPTSDLYNQCVQLPNPYRSEKLCRADHLYDLVMVISHNRSPTVFGKGSAVFFHLWRNPGRPTAGCIAMATENLLQLCREVHPGDYVLMRPFP